MAAMASMSPRISFSHDVDLHAAVPAAAERTSSSDHFDVVDFDFSVSCEVSADDFSSSPADHLFFQGKLLPLASLPPSSASSPLHHQIKKPPPPSSSSSSSSNIGRSSSVGTTSTVSSKLASVGPVFPRSKSTGSYLNPSIKSKSKSNQSQSQSQSLWKNWMRKKDVKSCYYYSGSKRGGAYSYGNNNNNGVRISPVINVPPPPFIPRGGSGGSSSTNSSGGGGGGFFAYLLCNCGDKSAKELEVGG